MRVEWLESGLGRPLTNRPVFDLHGNHLGTPDLIDPHTGVTGEYNGALHLAGSAYAADLAKDARFRHVGLEPVVMVAADRVDPLPFRVRLREAYRRTSSRPAADRGWTLELPRWWTPTHMVALRRGLTARQAERLLRYRLA